MSLPISVTYTFATATSSIPLSQLDANFTTVVNGINGIGNGTNALANVNITGGNATVSSLTSPTLNSSTTLSLQTGGTTGLYIDGSQNVGIGTTSPGAKLDVAGNMLLSGQSTADQYIRIGAFRSGNGYSYLDLQGDTTYSNGTRLIRLNSGANSNSSLEHHGTGYLQLLTYEVAPIVFFTNGANERMRIGTSGGVAIGTTTISTTRGITLPSDGAIETDGGTVYSVSIYNSTTAAGASVSITGTAGYLQRSVSSAKYKTQVEDLESVRSESIYQMRPVWYRSLCEMDRKDWSWYGLIAEEVAKIDPRLVHWGEVKKDGTQEPEGVMYDRLTVLLIEEVKKLKAEFDAYKAAHP
jgi:Chaperone of endosialidase